MAIPLVKIDVKFPAKSQVYARTINMNNYSSNTNCYHTCMRS